jgi:P-type Cu+ transporter
MLIVGILLLANIQLMPWMASAAMALSSVSVVVSSLLLRRFKKPKREEFEKSHGFAQWLTTMSSNIEIHRGIENMNQNGQISVISNAYSNGIKTTTSSTSDKSPSIAKSSHGKENKVAPARMNTVILDPHKLLSSKK